MHRVALLAAPLALFACGGGTSLPIVAQVAISPANPVTSDDLSCAATVDEQADPPITVAYRWTVNGQDIGAEGTTLSADHHGRGDLVVCLAAPSSEGAVGPVATSAVVIGNTAPSLLGQPVIRPEQADTGTTLWCEPPEAIDLDDDLIGFQYAWEVNGVAYPSTTPILEPTATAKGDSVVCAVSATDGADVGPAVSSAPLVIGNTAPVGTSAVITPGEATTETDLVCVGEATDADGDALTFAYTWWIDGAAGPTGGVLSASATRRDQVVQCESTPNDGMVDGSSVLSAPVLIRNAAPVVSGLNLTPVEPRTDDVLTANVSGTDADGDAVSFTYAWTVDGAEVQRGASPELASVFYRKRQEVAVAVTPFDGRESGEVARASTVVVNTPPTEPEILIGPPRATVRSDLVCEIVEPSFDADEDPITYTFRWEVDGTAWRGEAGSTHYDGDTVPSDATSPDEFWTCFVAASDGEATSPEAEDELEVLDREAPIASYTGGGQTVYRMAARPLPSGNAATWYQEICEEAGLRPVSCDPAVWGSSYDASAYNAVPLDRAHYSCNVSSGITSRTGWNDILTFHVPAWDAQGVCQRGCTITGSDVYPICTD